MTNNIDFSLSNKRKTVDYESFYSSKTVVIKSLSVSDRQSICASKISHSANSLRVDNVRNRIISLVKALEYISLKEIFNRLCDLKVASESEFLRKTPV